MLEVPVCAGDVRELAVCASKMPTLAISALRKRYHFSAASSSRYQLPPTLAIQNVPAILLGVFFCVTLFIPTALAFAHFDDPQKNDSSIVVRVALESKMKKFRAIFAPSSHVAFQNCYLRSIG